MVEKTDVVQVLSQFSHFRWGQIDVYYSSQQLNSEDIAHLSQIHALFSCFYARLKDKRTKKNPQLFLKDKFTQLSVALISVKWSVLIPISVLRSWYEQCCGYLFHIQTHYRNQPWLGTNQWHWRGRCFELFHTIIRRVRLVKSKKQTPFFFLP